MTWQWENANNTYILYSTSLREISDGFTQKSSLFGAQGFQGCVKDRVLVPRWEGTARTDGLNHSSSKVMMAVVNLLLLGSRVNTPEIIREFIPFTATVFS